LRGRDRRIEVPGQSKGKKVRRPYLKRVSWTLWLIAMSPATQEAEVGGSWSKQKMQDYLKNN
jgi:hypothetical protein